MPGLQLELNKQVLTPNASVACAIGGRAEWRIVTPGATEARWEFNKIGAVVAMYQPNATTVSLQAFGNTGVKTEWFWCQAGPVTVTARAKVLGREEVATIKVVVHQPLVIVTPEVAPSRLKTWVPIGREKDPNEVVTNLSLTRQDNGQGITFKVSFKPFNLTAGEVSVLQLLQVDRKKVSPTDTEDAQSSDKKWVVDRNFHYGILDASDDDAEEEELLKVAANQGITFSMSDGPTSSLGRPGDFSSAKIDEHYRVFVMYKPVNGAWMAVASREWNWTATAFVQAKKWVLKLGSPPTVTTPSHFPTMPVWVGSAQDYLGDDFG